MPFGGRESFAEADEQAQLAGGSRRRAQGALPHRAAPLSGARSHVEDPPPPPRPGGRAPRHAPRLQTPGRRDRLPAHALARPRRPQVRTRRWPPRGGRRRQASAPASAEARARPARRRRSALPAPRQPSRPARAPSRGPRPAGRSRARGDERGRCVLGELREAAVRTLSLVRARVPGREPKRAAGA